MGQANDSIRMETATDRLLKELYEAKERSGDLERANRSLMDLIDSLRSDYMEEHAVVEELERKVRGMEIVIDMLEHCPREDYRGASIDFGKPVGPYPLVVKATKARKKNA